MAIHKTEQCECKNNGQNIFLWENHGEILNETCLNIINYLYLIQNHHLVPEDDHIKYKKYNW